MKEGDKYVQVGIHSYGGVCFYWGISISIFDKILESKFNGIYDSTLASIIDIILDRILNSIHYSILDTLLAGILDSMIWCSIELYYPPLPAVTSKHYCQIY